jgi:DNA-binding Lrp family transcriptional regulator
VITKRDQEVLDFIDKFNVAYSSQIQRLFYPSQCVANRRLKEMVELKQVKRERANINYQYVYYAKKNNLFAHNLIVTEFYCRLIEEGFEIDEFLPAHMIHGIIPDAYVKAGYGDYTHHFFVEVHRSNNPFDWQKYLGIVNQFKVFPKIIVITDKKFAIPQNNLKFIFLKTDCKDIDAIK